MRLRNIQRTRVFWINAKRYFKSCDSQDMRRSPPAADTPRIHSEPRSVRGSGAPVKAVGSTAAPSGMSSARRDAQFINASAAISFNPPVPETERSETQFLNAPSGRTVTVSGRTASVKRRQSQNASLSNVSASFPDRSIFSSASAPRNAPSPISVTAAGG